MDEDILHSSKPIMGERHFQNVNNEEDFKRRWEESALNGNYSQAPPYERINVLLLSWKECCDNLKISEEIDRLQDVLENMVHYEIQRRYLCRHDPRSVQVQLNYIVSGFVSVCFGPNALFIVYYGGHAKPANRSLDLLMHTGMSSTTEDQVRYTSIERMLKCAQTDSLVILDCCHAGHAVLPAVETPTETAEESEVFIRKFERLGACGPRDITATPGKRSFTTAFIHAFANLLKTMPEGRFTISNLLSAIKDSRDFDNEKHPSHFTCTTLPGLGEIVLHPLPKAQTTKIPLKLRAKLGLQFKFSKVPSVDEMGTLSKLLNDRLAENELCITGIDFVGLEACPDSPSTQQELNHHASNGSKADDIIDDDVAVNIKAIRSSAPKPTAAIVTSDT
ncbi:hypothetical protein BDR22DRAFT_846057 [Usnea florida]